jgi:hypothetical protein
MSFFFPIIAVDSETDHLPRGDMRNYCSKDFLERSDKEASEYLKDCSDNVIEACLQLLDKFKEVKAE